MNPILDIINEILAAPDNLTLLKTRAQEAFTEDPLAFMDKYTPKASKPQSARGGPGTTAQGEGPAPLGISIFETELAKPAPKRGRKKKAKSA